MTEPLPEGWGTATCCDVVGAAGVFSDGDWIESKDQDPQGDVRLVQLADVGDSQYRNKSHRFLTSEKAAELDCTFLKPGDILIARMPEPLGRACIFPGDPKPCITAVDVCVIRPSASSIDSHWLLHTINSPQFRESISQYEMGTTRKRISRSNLGKIPLPIPPLAEQQRIVAKVDALLARVNAARHRLAKVPAILKRFRQSVLAAACSGRLTADWREEQDLEHASAALSRPASRKKSSFMRETDGFPELPEAWTWTNPDAVALEIVDCPHSTPRWAASGRVCFRTTNFRTGFLDLLEVRYVSEATYQERITRLEPKPGDVLYSREGGILGIACTIPPGVKGCLGQRMDAIPCSP